MSRALFTADFYADNIIGRVDTIPELLQVKTTLLKDGYYYLVGGFHSKGDGGGGVFYWNANEDKSNHNGGTIISPDAIFPSDWSDTNQQETWFTSGGTGNGCWKRIHDKNIDARWFGAKKDATVDSGNIIKHICNTFTEDITLTIDDIFYIISDVTIPDNVNLKFSNSGTLYVKTKDPISGESLGTGDGSERIFFITNPPALEDSEKVYIDGNDVTTMTKSFSNELIDVGDGSETDFSYWTKYFPLISSSVTIRYTIGSTTYTTTDDGNGNFSDTNLSGTVEYLTGKIILYFNSPPDNGTNIEVDYQAKYVYDFEPISGQVSFNIPPDNGATITIDYTPQYVVTIEEVVDAGIDQIFDGNGRVVIRPTIDRAYPEWFGATGDGTTDDYLPLQRCLNSVGNSAEIVFTKLYAVGSPLKMPSGGCVLTSNVSNSYFVDNDRYRYHLKCLFDDKDKALLYCPIQRKESTHTIRNLVIDMNGKQTPAIMNAPTVRSQICKWLIEHVSIENCGWHGIVINPGANVSKIINNFISAYGDFWDSNGNWIYDAFVENSKGIYMNCADCIVAFNEVKKGFDYGIYIDAGTIMLHNNISSQCKNGVYFGPKSGDAKVSCNRVTRCINGGVIIDNAYSIIFIGNFIARINSVKNGSGGGDGIGIKLIDAVRCIIAHNIFEDMNTMIALKGKSVVNTISDNDRSYSYSINTKYDYSEITSNWYNYIRDIDEGDIILYGNSIKSKIERSNLSERVFQGHIKMGAGVDSKGSHILPYRTEKSPSGDIQIQPTDGQFIELNPSTNITVTQYGFGEQHYGTIITIWNKSSSYNVSIAGITIGPGEIKQVAFTSEGLKPVT